MFRKIIIVLVIFFGAITFAQSDTTWIKKKDKSEKKIKILDLKKTSEKTSAWIKKKIKNKKDYKKEEKKITKEVKSWIKKKSKDKYIKDFNDLPDNAIFFTSYNLNKTIFLYGYVKPDLNSELVSGKFYKTSKGYGFIDDGKTTCKIGSTIIDVSDVSMETLVTARVSGECINGVKFTGVSSQTSGVGFGQAATKDGEDRFTFEFSIDKAQIAKLHDFNKSNIQFAREQESIREREDIELKPTGKYYALLIGNSKYVKWTSLTSPKNDVKAIAEILDKKYNFDVTTVIDGNYKQIFKAFNDLSKVTTDNDYVLIYYAGHGEIIEDRSYWIPTNAEKEFGFGDWINISDIEVYLEKKIPAHHLAVMVDSCYFAVSQKGSEDYSQENLLFQKYLKDRARIVLASGTNQPVDDTNKGNHSLFGFTFIKSLEQNKNAVNLLKIRDDLILAHSNKRQQPFGHGMRHWGHNGGDFVFIAKK